YGVLQIMNFISQPATFWRRSLVEQIGSLNEDLQYTMDYEYWLRIGRCHRLHVLPQRLAGFRMHALSKSGTRFEEQFIEELAVCQRYASPVFVQLHRLHNVLIVGVYKQQNQRI
ncbi:MAG: hypothetical protein K8R77_07465, partial [Anaerolineaceae bacterium]|nr:hypothetical protein [Anaerolineaceae bacterium]